MIGILITTVIAFIFGLIIVIIESSVKKPEQEEKFLELLPNYNCGACGFGSCRGMAHQMCKDVNSYKKCRPLKGEKLEKMQEYISKL